MGRYEVPPRGINPKLRWRYEREDAFNRACDSFGTWVIAIVVVLAPPLVYMLMQR
jgi:hypothetical protein